jgi:hypothetical protein
VKRKILIPVIVAACGVAWAATAQTPAHARNAPSGNAAEQRLRQDVQALLTHMAASGALGQHPEALHLRVEQPAQRVSDLGVLIDSTSAERARDGLRVLGTSPGSTAERLGLRPGDVLVGVNGTSLRNLGPDGEGRALAASTLKSAVDRLPDATPLQLDIEREGNLLALNAPVHSVLLPALSLEIGSAEMAAAAPTAADAHAGTAAAEGGCGRISTFDVSPPSDQQYHAKIITLDGTSPGPSGHETYRVSAGEHHLVVSEDIPTNFMGAGPIATWRSRNHSYKPLTVVVKPGTTTMIAAQLHTDRVSEIGRGGYWDPVAWREVAEDCP